MLQRNHIYKIYRCSGDSSEILQKVQKGESIIFILYKLFDLVIYTKKNSCFSVKCDNMRNLIDHFPIKITAILVIPNS